MPVSMAAMIQARMPDQQFFLSVIKAPLSRLRRSYIALARLSRYSMPHSLRHMV